MWLPGATQISVTSLGQVYTFGIYSAEHQNKSMQPIFDSADTASADQPRIRVCHEYDGRFFYVVCYVFLAFSIQFSLCSVQK